MLGSGQLVPIATSESEESKMADKKESCIETFVLTIKGNIVTREGTMIQLRNISCITTESFTEKGFPWLSLLPILFGFYAMSQIVMLGIVCIIIGAGWIYFWYTNNESLKNKKTLSILLNSGNTMQLIFQSNAFLRKY